MFWWWMLFIFYLGITTLIVVIGMKWSFNVFRNKNSITWQSLLNSSLSIMMIGVAWPLIAILILSIILKIVIHNLITTIR